VAELPRLYAIIDAGVLSAGELAMEQYAACLRDAGVSLLQYRNKSGSDVEMLRDAETLLRVFEGSGTTLIMNDRVDLALAAGFDGVHLGQGDLSPGEAKAVALAARPHPSQEREGWATRFVVGVSTHTEAQVLEADAGPADYVAIGPVFATGTKRNAEPVVGLEGVRRARALTRKPLVAIGGMTRENARSVIDAGADSVAVISGLIVDGEPVEKVARDFIERLR
jgi:thiamine-phosphate pyrophosphorylase